MIRLPSRLRARASTKSGRGAAAVTLLGVLTLGGCITREAPFDQPPRVAEVSKQNHTLRSLPRPARKVPVAVYDLEDLTGQYKDVENTQTLSRAVTQGGSAILIKALEDAGERRWFTVLERKNLANLLKERQIVTEMRRVYRNEAEVDAGVLPPLMNASIIVEGGIIGYDSNVMTGGAGARFLGIGGDGKYLQDVVTVSLRAVSIKSGEVLTAVTVRKAIASYSIQGGAFRYVDTDKLLEAEAGVTYNEPKQIATESAVEAAVLALIVEGVERGVWSFRDRREGEAWVDAYRKEKYGARLTADALDPEPVAADVADDVPQTIAAAKPVAARVTTSSAVPPSVAKKSSPPSADKKKSPDTSAPKNGDKALPPLPQPDEPAMGSSDPDGSDAAIQVAIMRSSTADR